jgi:two-component system nitrate/nitrite response regulator NarL
MTEPLRILIADDHAFFRRGIREVLEEQADMRVVAEVADGEEAIRRVRELGTRGLDLVLMDIEMPGLGGIAAVRRLLAEEPGMPVIMLTVSTAEDDLIAAARAGAVGFLNKSLAPAALVRALRDFHREGALPMSRTMAARLLTHFRQVAAAVPPDAPSPAGAPAEQLTPREREILALLASGARDREIAAQLSLAENTVKTHVQNILRKLGARNRTAAVARLRRDGH